MPEPPAAARRTAGREVPEQEITERGAGGRETAGREAGEQAIGEREAGEREAGEQEIAAHVFVPLDAPDAAAAQESLWAMWDRFGRQQGADRPVRAATPHRRPDALPQAPVHGSVAVAAAQSHTGLDQMLVRRDRAVLNLSLLLGAAPGRAWPDLERRMAGVLGAPDGTLGGGCLGGAVLALGKSAAGAPGTLDLTEADRSDEPRSLRRLRLLGRPGEDGRLSAWAWSANGSMAMPPFVRYLMHMAALRHQLRAHRRLAAGGPPGSAGPRAVLRVPYGERFVDLDSPAERLAAVRTAVDTAWDNARRALRLCEESPGAGALADRRVLDDDRDFVAWFRQDLADHAALLRFAPPTPTDRPPHPAPAPPAEPQPEPVRPTDPPPEAGGPGPAPLADPPPEAATPVRPADPPSEAAPVALTASGPRAASGVAPRGPVRVLAVVDEWLPAHGGVSNLNRALCRALAAAGAEVYVLLPAAGPAEQADAAAAGVRLVEAARPDLAGPASLMRRARLPAGVVPDLVIGHGRLTGPAARAQTEDHFGGVPRRLHFLHVEPDRNEWFKDGRGHDLGARAEERTLLELELARGAWRILPVGPRLESMVERERGVPAYQDLPPTLRIDPGFDTGRPGPHPPPAGVPQILLMGRMADDEGKGLNIACRALGRAVPERSAFGRWELLVRGAAEGTSQAVRAEVEALVDNPAVEVTVRPYTPDPARIAADLARASLVLMPSRAESFGLVGAEAVGDAVPALVSGRSGLGIMLAELLPARWAEQVVVDVAGQPARIEEDVARWAARIGQVMYDLPTSFRRAAELRRHLVEQAVTWADVARRVLALADG